MIKKLLKIIIIVTVMASLYLLSDDVIGFIKNRKVELTKSVQSSNLKESAAVTDGILVDVKKVIDTPGALRIRNVFDFSSDTNLTITGIINETNNERSKENLTQLTENADLDTSAEIKVNDMFNKQYFEHISPAGVGVGDLGKSVGYEYIIIGENLALGNFKDDKGVVAAWMASPGHRANILNKNYTNIGVYAREGIFEGKKTWIAVQHFGTPQSLCPKIDQNLKTAIQSEQTKLKIMQTDLAKKLKDINSNEVVDGKDHNEQVAIYNLLVNKYNDLVAKSKNDISKYNTEVRSFNKCVESRQ